MLLSVWWSAREASGRLISISDVCEHVWVRMVFLRTETDQRINHALDQREAVISGAAERREFGRTPENVVLVVLVGLGSHFDETRESLCHHKLVHQVLVILEETGERMRYRIRPYWKHAIVADANN